MFTLNENTWRALIVRGSPVARPRSVGWYRRTFTPSTFGGGPDSRVRTSTLIRFARAIVMYLAWTPAPPLDRGRVFPGEHARLSSRNEVRLRRR